jgi:hypothetical protein
MANTTWNPSDKTAGITLSGGNLVALASTGTQGVRAADLQYTGKFYFEVTVNVNVGNNHCLGFVPAGTVLGTTFANNLASSFAGRQAIVNSANSSVYINGVIALNLSGTAWVAGTLVCIAIDLDAGLVWFREGAAGSWNTSASANPATGAGGVATGYVRTPVYPVFQSTTSGQQVTANFGDAAFSGAVPSGFTSGWPAGATAPSLAAAVTQSALEQWADGNPAARLTSVALEHWATPTGTGVAAQITQVALEHWAAVPAPAAGVVQPQLIIVT